MNDFAKSRRIDWTLNNQDFFYSISPFLILLLVYFITKGNNESTLSFYINHICVAASTFFILFFNLKSLILNKLGSYRAALTVISCYFFGSSFYHSTNDILLIKISSVDRLYSFDFIIALVITLSLFALVLLASSIIANLLIYLFIPKNFSKTTS